MGETGRIGLTTVVARWRNRRAAIPLDSDSAPRERCWESGTIDVPHAMAL
jgi:hypothetical protein